MSKMNELLNQVIYKIWTSSNQIQTKQNLRFGHGLQPLND
jgi:hypothetical protein